MSKFWDDIPVAARSLREIEQRADQLRLRAGYTIDDRIVHPTLLARVNIRLTARSGAQMAGAKALASPKRGEDEVFAVSGFEAAIRDDVDPYVRFDFGHELGHLLLHRESGLMKPRMVGGNKQLKFVRVEESAEFQADQFARAFLLSRGFSFWGQPDEVIARIVGMPVEQVAIRREETNSRKVDVPLVTSLARQHLKRLELWRLLPQIAGEDPGRFRLCDGFRICWEDFDKRYPPHQMGWYLRNNQIMAAIRDQGF